VENVKMSFRLFVNHILLSVM